MNSSIASRSFRDNSSGFTLIEMMVVIALLGILAGIVIPSVMFFMDSGKEPAFETENQNIQTATTALMVVMRTDTLQGAFVDDGQWHNDFTDPESVYAQNDDGIKLSLTEVIAPGHLETAFWYKITSDGKVSGRMEPPL